MKAQEYVKHDATGLATLVRDGEVKRSEVLDAAIEVAERRNPAINALCHSPFEAVREATAARDDDVVLCLDAADTP